MDETPARPNETDGLIEHEIRIAAAPEIVFAHFTDPAKMVRWMGTEATLDPRPGGVSSCTGACTPKRSPSIVPAGTTTCRGSPSSPRVPTRASIHGARSRPRCVICARPGFR